MRKWSLVMMMIMMMMMMMMQMMVKSMKRGPIIRISYVDICFKSGVDMLSRCS